MDANAFGLSRDPFLRSPDLDEACLPNSMASLLSECSAGLRCAQGVSVLVGERGTGTGYAASIFLRRVASATQATVAVRPTSSASAIARDALLVLDPDRAADVDDDSWVKALRDLLVARAAAGRSTVLMIDDAGRLSPQALDDLAQLFDDEDSVRLHLFLVGGPSLIERLNAGSERALLAHVLQICRVEPLSLRETVRYLERRLAMCGAEMLAMFDEEAVDEVVRRSGGRLERIEEVADGALLRATARGAKRATAADVAGVPLDDEVEEVVTVAPKQEDLRFETHEDEGDDDSWSADADEDADWSDDEQSDEWVDDEEADDEWTASDDEEEEDDAESLRWGASSRDFDDEDLDEDADVLAQEPRAGRGAVAVGASGPPPRIAGRAVLSAVACLGLVWAANQLPGTPETDPHGRDVKLFAEPLKEDPAGILRLAGSPEAADADAHVHLWQAQPPLQVARASTPGVAAGSGADGEAKGKGPVQVAQTATATAGAGKGTASVVSREGEATRAGTKTVASSASAAATGGPVAGSKAAAPASVASSTTRSTASATKASASKATASRSTASASTASKATASKATASSKKGSVYTVQLGAFKTRRNAEEMVNRLRGKSPRILQEGGFYRVVSGSFSSKKDASLHEASLKRAGYNTYVRTAVF